MKVLMLWSLTLYHVAFILFASLESESVSTCAAKTVLAVHTTAGNASLDVNMHTIMCVCSMYDVRTVVWENFV